MRFGLANRRLQPLGHLTVRLQVYGSTTPTRKWRNAGRGWRVTSEPPPLPLTASGGVIWCVVRALARAQSHGAQSWAQCGAIVACSIQNPKRKHEKATVSLT